MEIKKNPHVDLEKKKKIFTRLGLVIVLSFVLIGFEWKWYEVSGSDLGELILQADEEEDIDNTFREDRPPPPPPPPPPAAPEVITIVEDKTDIEDEIQIDDAEANSETEIDMTEEVVEEEEIFTIVEEMPTFPECKDAADKQKCFQEKVMGFLSKNIKYPDIASDAGIQGKVYVSFVVGKTGEVRDVKVLRGVPGGASLDKEAVRVIESLPKLMPGKQRGKAVSVNYTIPVIFRLN